MHGISRACTIFILPMLAALSLNACKSIITREGFVLQGARQRLDLNGTWLIAFDLKNTGLEDGWPEGPPVDVAKITVPGAWQNTKGGAGYDGVAWYYKSFELPDDLGGRLTLQFEDVNYHAKVWLNGSYVGEHEGGYVPFGFDVRHLAMPGATNNLVVRVADTPRSGYVDGRNLYEVPHAKESWYVNFGGICGDVGLVAHGDAWIEGVLLVPDAEATAITVHGRVGAGVGAHLLTLAASAAMAHDATAEYGSASVTVDFEEGNEATLRIPLREALAWSPQHPFLYRVTVRLVRRQEILDEVSDTVGLRSFDIRNNNFYLNGRRIVLKAVVNQPFLPATPSRPPDADWCRRQVRLMKEAGFNAVQNRMRPAPKEFLYEADRQGLLVFQQPAIGWTYCLDDEQLYQRLREQVRGMVMRDRNHPSIVMWGIFNAGSVPQLLQRPPVLSTKLAKIIRRLDPTRPILDEAGSARARCYAAGSDEAVPYFDAHWYPITPVSDAQSRRLRSTLEQRGGKALCVISEYGSGGITNLDAAVKGHERPYRFREDCRYFAALRHKIRKSVGDWPLNIKFGSVKDFTAALQQGQARAVREQNEMLARDPNIDMMSLAQWQDCMTESTGGLVDVWGNPKPAWKTAKELNSPSRLIISALRPTLFIGEDAAVEAVVVNEPAARGPAVLAIEFLDPFGNRAASPELHVELSGERIQALGTVKLGPPRCEGTHTIDAELIRFGDTIASAQAQVIAISREAANIASPVTVYDPSEKLNKYLAGRQATTNDLANCEKVYPVIIAARLGTAPPSVAARFFAAVKDGAWAIVLSPPHPGEPMHITGMLSPGIETVENPSMGYHAYSIPHPIFEGLPVEKLFGREYRNVMPFESLTPSSRFEPQKTWESVCGLVTGYRGFVGHCVLLMPMGEGMIILNTLRLAENLGVDPLADRILANMVRYAERAGGRTEARPLLEEEIRSAQEEYERLLAEAGRRSRECLLVGPWPLKPPDAEGSSFDMILPPERNLDPSATYASWDDADIRWQKGEISHYGRLVLPREFRRRYIVGYAYTYLRSPEAFTAELVISSGKPIKAWFDSREKYLARDPITRVEGYHAQRKEIRCRVKVRKGLNQLLIKFGWAGGPSHIDIRFLRDGRQAPGLEYVAPKTLDLIGN